MRICVYPCKNPHLRKGVRRIFARGEAGLPQFGCLCTPNPADVGSTEASNRTPTCQKQGFVHGTRHPRGFISERRFWRKSKNAKVNIKSEVEIRLHGFLFYYLMRFCRHFHCASSRLLQHACENAFCIQKSRSFHFGYSLLSAKTSPIKTRARIKVFSFTLALFVLGVVFWGDFYSHTTGSQAKGSRSRAVTLIRLPFSSFTITFISGQYSNIICLQLPQGGIT